MIRIILLFFLILPVTTMAQMTAMTYNIRYNNPNDGEDWWENRKGDVVSMLQYYEPDILGIQEGLYDQVTFLDESLTSHNFVGVGRDDGKTKGEYAAIFYKAETLALVNSSTFWLSETPEEISVGWDASMERIVTYAHFKLKASGLDLHVFNAHFDHIGTTAREESAKLIVNLIKSKNLEQERVILMGDLNSSPEENPILTLSRQLDDTYSTGQHPPYGPIGTFNQFDPAAIPLKRIDYIFIKNIRVDRYRTIDDRRPNNRQLSDHLPIMVTLNKE